MQQHQPPPPPPPQQQIALAFVGSGSLLKNLLRLDDTDAGQAPQRQKVGHARPGQARTRRTCAVIVAQRKTNANDAGVGPERAREIEALISKLKRSGKGGATGGHGTELREGSIPESGDKDVDDALRSEAGQKKLEDVLLQEMRAAEAFMSGASSGTAKASAPDDKPFHQPKVSTWGVFPRPKNISSAYGGGKNLPTGGVDLSNEEELKKQEETRKKLAAYRKAMGIDVEKEEEHREEIKAKLDLARVMVFKSRPYEAVEALESVLDYVSPLSRLGGDVYLELALTNEILGNSERARELYGELRRSPYSDIRSKVKQLAFGFQAMDALKVDTSREGLKVMDFKLPDFAALTPDRYDTSYSEVGLAKERKIREEMGLLTEKEKASNSVVFLVFVGLIATVILNILLRK
ncbi:hypothetical protein FVE85_5386 [Porphyridium purpureum]|uniref:Uncharacterized protein n=1 Tax=Porphyridium purpureum TaxID=35688 RepID=A0A5J4Z1S6_PORPP|nr:hypothetical protein FVE85_5386 [Porphyridium purpureum]|eukprot:POR4659..scf295_1